MARLLITATCGHDNATRASMPFYVARGAKETGVDVGVVLALDATVLVRPEIRKHVQPHGQPALEELSSSPSTIGCRCMSEGVSPDPGVLDGDLERYANVEKIDVKRYAQVLTEYERSVMY